MNGIKKEQGANVNQILGALTRYHAVSIIMGNATAVTENGRKVVKAGTPLAGDMTRRETAFTVGSGADVVGLLLHDVDVTEGPANGTCLAGGVVNVDRLDATTAALITAEVKAALKGKIEFIAD